MKAETKNIKSKKNQKKPKEKYNTTEIIDFLRKQEDLGLDDDDLEIIREQKINGHAFLNITEEKLQNYGMKGGPASNIAEFVKKYKEKKLRAFSSYKTREDLNGILAEYGILSGDITRIPQFKPRK